MLHLPTVTPIPFNVCKINRGKHYDANNLFDKHDMYRWLKYSNISKYGAIINVKQLYENTTSYFYKSTYVMTF